MPPIVRLEPFMPLADPSTSRGVPLPSAADGALRIALIADTHLSERAPQGLRHWQVVQDAMRRHGADFAIHLGDVCADAPRQPEDLACAAEFLRRSPRPCYTVPGNHDSGEGSGEEPLRTDLRAQCEALLGPARWRLALGRVAPRWHFIGIDAQLLGSGSAEEASQERWLAGVAATLRRDDQVVLCLHRPLLSGHVDGARPAGWYAPPAAALRLLAGPLSRHLKLVVSGHLHRHLDRVVDGLRHLWVPSTAYTLDPGRHSAMLGMAGTDVLGFVLLTLDDDRIVADLISPEGLAAG